MHQNPNKYIGDYPEADPMPASPIQSAVGDVHEAQHRTADLIDNLFNRLNAVLDHGNKVSGVGGPQPVPPNASPLHGELMVIAERQGTQNQRLSELLNRITL